MTGRRECMKALSSCVAAGGPGRAKSDHERLAQQVCHPEPFGSAQDKLREGSRGQILRCAQNDTSERLRRKVYQCRAFRFSETPGSPCWQRVRGVAESTAPAAPVAASRS